MSNMIQPYTSEGTELAYDPEQPALEPEHRNKIALEYLSLRTKKPKTRPTSVQDHVWHKERT